MPPNWDARIPVPPGATLISSTTPKDGSAYTAEFLGPRGYADLVEFYESELPKAGFKMGQKHEISKRKLYKRTFSDGNIQDEVVISPSRADDPALLTIHITYRLPASALHSKPGPPD